MSFGASGGSSNNQATSQSQGYGQNASLSNTFENQAYDPTNQNAMLANINGASALTAPAPYTGSDLNLNTNSGVAGFNPSTVNPQTLASTNLQPYLNPYTANVVNASNNELNQQQQQQIQQNNGNATAQGAFGGTGAQVANALTNQNYSLAQSQMDANLNQAGFANAQGAAQQDIANNQAAQTSNQQAGIQGANTQLAGQNLNANNALQNYGAGWQRYTTGLQYPLQAQGVINQAYGLLGNTPLTQAGSTTQSAGYTNSESGSQSSGNAFNLGFQYG